MNQELRGGNSRLLAKSLDQLQHPIAILDRRGNILFVNAALCSMVSADPTNLVGQTCSWQIASDDTPYSALLTALAPPAGALQGKVVVRQLTTPIVFGSTSTGQLFVPILDEHQIVHQTLVVLGKWEDINTQLPSDWVLSDLHRRQRTDQILVAIRSRWTSLDQLMPLVGESPTIQLAMTRAQLAVSNDCNFMITGPKGMRKTEVAQGIFWGRLRRAGIKRISAQFLPLDCSVLNELLFAGMLDVFAGRLRENASKVSQQLHLERIDQLSIANVAALNNWLARFGSRCNISATGVETFEQLLVRSESWAKLLAQVAQIQLHLPPLQRRPEDIAPLAQHLLAKICTQRERAQLVFSHGAIDALTTFPWPENVTQLASVVQDAVDHAVLSATVQINHLPVAVRSFASSVLQSNGIKVEPIELDTVLLDIEKVLLERALKLSPRNRAQAARWLGISRPRLLRRITQLGLDSSLDEDIDEN